MPLQGLECQVFEPVNSGTRPRPTTDRQGLRLRGLHRGQREARPQPAVARGRALGLRARVDADQPHVVRRRLARQGLRYGAVSLVQGFHMREPLLHV